MAQNRNFQKGEIIFREGALELFMYDVLSGKVGIYLAYGTENERLLTEVEAGGCFGEMGLSETMPRSATAVALEDAVLAQITIEEFGEYFKDEPQKVTQILSTLGSRLRSLSDAYIDACRTAADYADAERAQQPKDAGLLSRVERLIGLHRIFGKG